MAKRRSCRRTEQEDIFHDRAVKIRKMTDEQLCTYIDKTIETAYQKGLAENKHPEPSSEKSVGEFIAAIAKAKVPGIGVVTIKKLLKVATENGYIKES